MIESGSIRPPRQWLIFSTLDDVLLDGQGRDAYELQAVFAALHFHGVPVIFNSSKTPRELTQVADALHLDVPRIAEDGSVITYPRELRVRFLGMDYERICDILNNLRSTHGYRFKGFHDWTVEEIAFHTGLKLETARVARQRKGSEPLLWEDTPERLESFRQQLATFELELKRCEHFWRVTGRTGKAHALRDLHQEYTRLWGYAPCIIALGEYTEDQSMLAAADIAVIVRNNGNPGFDASALKAAGVQHVIHTQAPGAAGWSEAITQLLAMSGQPLDFSYSAQRPNKRSR